MLKDWKNPHVYQDMRRIDQQTKRENSGKGSPTPKWVKDKAHIPSKDTLATSKPDRVTVVRGLGGDLRVKTTPSTSPSLQGSYAGGKSHPSKWGSLVALKSKPKPFSLTEGDIPFCQREEKHTLRDAKAEGKLFPGWGKNPLAGLPSTLSPQGKGKAVPSIRHSSPIQGGLTLRMQTMGYRPSSGPIRPPLQRG